jgi:two-component system phosphate regulon response regulator OmpR
MANAPRGTRVLVIDDEALICRLLTMALTGDGYEVETVENAADGRQAFARTTYDVLIADLNLPGTRGYDLAAEARRLNPLLRTIILTGESDTDTDEASREWQVDRVLTKPFQVSDLLLALGDLIEQARPPSEPRT